MKNFILLLILALCAPHAIAQLQRDLGVDKLKLGTNSVYDPEIDLGGFKIKKNKATNKGQFSNDGVIWKNIGSGSGNGSGAISILENGGFEDGIGSDWNYSPGVVTEASEPLIGEKSAKFDPANQYEFLRTKFITVPKGLRGAACEARFMYIGFDENIHAYVENEAGVILGRYQRPEAGSVVYGLPTHTISGYESIFFKCPTEEDITANALNGNIRVVFIQDTTNDAEEGVVDDVHLGALIGLVETTTPDGFEFEVNVDNSLEGGDGIVTSCSGAASSRSCSLEGLTVPPICSISAASQDNASISARILSTSASQITFTTNSTSNAVMGRASFICKKQGADAKQSVQVYKSIPKASQIINELSAQVSSTGVISDENVPWLSSCSVSGTSYTCGIQSGVTSTGLNCSISIATSGWDGTISNVNSTSTTLSWVTNNTNTPSAPKDFNIVCQKKDYKLPTVQPVILGQVTNSVAESSLTNVRIESCKISNHLIADSSCNTWISSTTATNSTTTTITYKSGVWSKTPTCTSDPIHTGGNILSWIHSESSSGIVVRTQDTTGASVGAVFNLICIGEK